MVKIKNRKIKTVKTRFIFFPSRKGCPPCNEYKSLVF